MRKQSSGEKKTEETTWLCNEILHQDAHAQEFWSKIHFSISDFESLADTDFLGRRERKAIAHFPSLCQAPTTCTGPDLTPPGLGLPPPCAQPRILFQPHPGCQAPTPQQCQSLAPQSPALPSWLMGWCPLDLGPALLPWSCPACTGPFLDLRLPSLTLDLYLTLAGRFGLWWHLAAPQPALLPDWLRGPLLLLLSPRGAPVAPGLQGAPCTPCPEALAISMDWYRACALFPDVAGTLWINHSIDTHFSWIYPPLIFFPLT